MQRDTGRGNTRAARHWAAWTVTAGMAAAFASDVIAQGAYPTKPIRVVIPFAAAGVTDIVGRIVLDEVAQRLGQQVVVDNRPGAGGTIAFDQVAHAPPDGYTLVVGDPSGSLAANASLYPKLNYNAATDLAPIGFMGRTGAVIAVSNELPVHTLAEFVALAKAKPGALMFGSTGSGNPGHLNVELFKRQVGIEVVHVPYRVVSQAVTDLLTGRIAFWIAPLPTVLPQIQAGQLRALAVSGEARSGDLPDVPTVKELGFGDYDVSTTYAAFAPAGTPSPIIARLSAEIAAVVAIPAVQERLRKSGVDPKTGGPDEVRAVLESRMRQWAEVIHAAGIRIEER